jgi:hypothetical protein
MQRDDDLCPQCTEIETVPPSVPFVTRRLEPTAKSVSQSTQTPDPRADTLQRPTLQLTYTLHDHAQGTVNWFLPAIPSASATMLLNQLVPSRPRTAYKSERTGQEGVHLDMT